MKAHRGSRGTDSSTLFLTPALDWGGGLTPRPGRFNPGKDSRCPLCMLLGGLQGRFERVRKISPPLGFDLRTVQPVDRILVGRDFTFEA